MNNKTSEMTSSKPYLLRAMFDWLVENDCTPHIVVDASATNVEVPQDFVKDGQIVLNIAPRAVSDFHMDTQGVGFNARFGGIPTDVYTPVHAIMGIYARENGKGMMFEKEGPTDGGPDDSGAKKRPSPARKPGLRVVK